MKVNCRVSTSLTAYFTSISLAFFTDAISLEYLDYPASYLASIGQNFALPLRDALQVLYSRLSRTVRFKLLQCNFLQAKKKKNRESQKISKETGSQIERERERDAK